MSYASADAFGNAIGNSVVRGAQESAQRKRDLQAFSEQLNDVNNQRAVDSTNNAINNIANETAGAVATQAGRITSALARNNAIDANASFAAMEAARTGRSQQIVDSFYDTANAAYQRTVSGISAGLAAGNAVRERLAGVTEASIARRQAGNALAASQFDAIGVSGFDVRDGYDWEAAAQWENAVWGRGKSASDPGQLNAIEIEFGGVISPLFFNFGGVGSVTFDNQGNLTIAKGGIAGINSTLDVNASASLGILKGYGTDSYDLGAGLAESTYYGASLSDGIEAIFGEKAGKLSRLKGADIGVFREEGYVLNTDNFSREFEFEGYGVDLSLGWDDVSKPLNLGGKLTPLPIEVGAEYEYSVPVQSNVRSYELGASGRFIYSVLNNSFFWGN